MTLTKNFILSFVLIIISQVGFSQIPDQKPNNETVRGDGTTSTEKSLRFNTGQGAQDPKLFTTDGNQLGASTSNFVVGKGQVEDVLITIDAGLGTSNPFLRWDSTLNQIAFSNDGTNALPLGSGGGGGGVNFNNAFGTSDNANAEAGTTGFNYVGASVFSALSNDPLEGSSSFNILNGGEGEFLTSPFLNVNRQIFRGRSCEASFEYIGGEEGLLFRVLDASGNVFVERELPAHTISAPESVFFLCPSVSRIAANPDLANLQISIESPTGVNFGNFTFDRFYLGTLQALTETVLPNTFVANFNNATTSFDNSAGGLESVTCSESNAGDHINYDCDTTSLGLTSRPVCVANRSEAGAAYVAYSYSESTTTNINFRSQLTTANTQIVSEFSFICHKTGADARQRVQVFKSIPRVSENFNEFSARSSAGGVVSGENIDFIEGDFSVSNTSTYTSNFVPGTFDSPPNCQCTIETTATTAQARVCHIISSSPSSIVYQTQLDTIRLAQGVTLSCQKGSDFQLPTVQPVIVGQRTDSVLTPGTGDNGKARLCSWRSNTNGTAIDTEYGECISSITAGPTGRHSPQFESGYWLTRPMCTCVVVATTGGDRECNADSNEIRVDVALASNNSEANFTYMMICHGVAP